MAEVRCPCAQGWALKGQKLAFTMQLISIGLDSKVESEGQMTFVLNISVQALAASIKYCQNLPYG